MNMISSTLIVGLAANGVVEDEDFESARAGYTCQRACVIQKSVREIVCTHASFRICSISG